MAKNGENTHFFRTMLPCIIQNGTLELPRNFVKEHRKRLSMYARLKVPTGSESKIQLKRCNGRAWLDQGWPDFVDKYSIKCGYFLMFKYEGGSHFTVLIFDLSTLEIEYPVSARTSNRKVEECKVIEVKEEDRHDDYDKISDECALEIRKGGEMDSATKSRIEGRSLGGTSARERVVERAMTFESLNPHFIVIMRPVYVSAKYNSLHIPKGPARSYFLKKENRHITFKGADGRAWPVKYYIGAPPRQRVTIYKGWNKFVRENHLREGDVCVFELVSSKAMAFKVTIFRITDEQADKNDPLGMPDTASPRCKRTPAWIATPTQKGHLNKGVKCATNKREAYDVSSNAIQKVLKRPGSFMIYMSSKYISRGANVHIPTLHFKRYLRDEEHGENIIVLHGSNGKTWSVKYSFSSAASISKKGAFMHGWKEFASDNRLQAGDICVFEMITRKVRAYKVTISRVADRA